ncbi:TolC family protein [bacterium CPR1]|nr:TolC family protein [bacterium CPR1]
MRTLLLVLAMLSCPLAAAPSLTLEQAVKEVVNSHPSLSRLGALRRVAAARTAQASSQFLPQIGLEAVAREGPAAAVGLGFTGLSNSILVNNLGADVVVSQTLVDFGRRSHEVLSRRWDEQASGQDLDAQRARLILETHRRFYRSLLAGRLRQLADAELVLRQSLLQLAQKRYQTGLSSRLDEEVARSQVAEARAELTRARQEEELARASLGELLGRAELGEQLQEPVTSMEPLAPLTVEERPELKALDRRIQAQQEAIRAAAAAGLPVLRAVLTGGAIRVADGQTGNHNYAVGMALTWPFFTGGRVEAEVDEQQHRLEALQAQREELVRSLALELRSAELWLESLEEIGATVEDQLQAASSAARLAHRRYEIGLGTLLEAQQARQGLLSAQTQAARVDLERRLARATVLHAAGKLGE